MTPRYRWRTSIALIGGVVVIGVVVVGALWLILLAGRSDLRRAMADPEIVRCLTLTPRLRPAPLPGHAAAFIACAGRCSHALDGAQAPHARMLLAFRMTPTRGLPWLDTALRRVLRSVLAASAPILTPVRCSAQLDAGLGDPIQLLAAIAAADLAVGDATGIPVLDALERIADADDAVDEHVCIEQARGAGLLLAHCSGCLAGPWKHWASIHPDAQPLFPILVSRATLQTSGVRALLDHLAGRTNGPREASGQAAWVDLPLGPWRAARALRDLDRILHADWHTFLAPGQLGALPGLPVHSGDLEAWDEAAARKAADHLSHAIDGYWRAMHAIASIVDMHATTGAVPDTPGHAALVIGQRYWHGTTAATDLHYCALSREACLIRVGPWLRSQDSERAPGTPDVDAPEMWEQQVVGPMRIGPRDRNEWQIDLTTSPSRPTVPR